MNIFHFCPVTVDSDFHFGGCCMNLGINLATAGIVTVEK